MTELWAVADSLGYIGSGVVAGVLLSLLAIGALFAISFLGRRCPACGGGMAKQTNWGSVGQNASGKIIGQWAGHAIGGVGGKIVKKLIGKGSHTDSSYLRCPRCQSTKPNRLPGFAAWFNATLLFPGIFGCFIGSQFDSWHESFRRDLQRELAKQPEAVAAGERERIENASSLLAQTSTSAKEVADFDRQARQELVNIPQTSENRPRAEEVLRAVDARDARNRVSFSAELNKSLGRGWKTQALGPGASLLEISNAKCSDVGLSSLIDRVGDELRAVGFTLVRCKAGKKSFDQGL